MRKLCLLLVALLIAIPAAAITPQEVLKKDGKRVGAFECGQKEVIGVIESMEENWKIFLNARNGKIIMVEGDEEGNVVRVVFGVASLNEKKTEVKLEVFSEMSAEDAQKYFPDPCGFLTAKEV